jgi:microcystin degradation protein MlrC
MTPQILRAYLAGMMHETNSFSPIPTGTSSFAAGTVESASGRYVASETVDTLGYGHLARQCLDAGFDLWAGVFTHAKPSAPMAAPVHHQFVTRMLEDLQRAMPVDMVFLVLHGAQLAQGCHSVEADLVSRVRYLVGPDVPIGVLLDLHANIAPALLSDSTLVVACLEYPHTDYAERSAHLFRCMERLARGELRPVVHAWRMPILGLFRTTQGPMRSFVEALRGAESEPGIHSISAFHGFPFGDTPHTGATLVVACDAHCTSAMAVGASLAQAYVDAALGAEIPSLGVEQVLDEALASRDVPVVIGDSGDNPGGGAAGDSTHFLRALLRRGVTNAAIGMLWDPAVVAFAHSAGVGARIALRLGGKVSQLSGDPVDVVAEVTALKEDAAQAWFAQGEPKAWLGRSAALRINGITVVVNSERQQVFDPRCFSLHGIDITACQLVVVKGSTHFANGFAPLAGSILYCDSPGSVSMDLRKLPYQLIGRPIYPLDQDFMPTPSVIPLP